MLAHKRINPNRQAQAHAISIRALVCVNALVCVREVQNMLVKCPKTRLERILGRFTCLCVLYSLVLVLARITIVSRASTAAAEQQQQQQYSSSRAAAAVQQQQSQRQARLYAYFFVCAVAIMRAI